MADMLRIQQEAKDRGFDSAEFFISAPKGVFKAKWLDAYFGFFTIPELGDGFLSEKHLPRGCEGFWTEEEAKEHNAPFNALFRALNGQLPEGDDQPACGQYARHLGVDKWDVGVTAGSFWDQANEIAFEVPSPKTFGALASRLRAAIAEQRQ